MRSVALLCGLAVLAADPASSTTVSEPTFDELVLRAESVVVARVVSTRSAWVDSRSGRSIVTDVTVAIEQTIKGPEFLGGTVGDDTLRVEGIPQFEVGDRDVLFVNEAGRPASPLVGFMYGRFRIMRDPRTGADMVRTHDGRPLASTEDVGNAKPPARVAPARTLTLADFIGAIRDRARIQAQGGR
jgi:hypothetical protein